LVALFTLDYALILTLGTEELNPPPFILENNALISPCEVEFLYGIPKFRE